MNTSAVMVMGHQQQLPLCDDGILLTLIQLLVVGRVGGAQCNE